MSDELKPCPFCGCDKANIIHHSDSFKGKKLLSVVCANMSCGARVLAYDDDATNRWNTRHQPNVEDIK